MKLFSSIFAFFFTTMVLNAQNALGNKTNVMQPEMAGIQREIPGFGDCDNMPVTELRKCNLKAFQNYIYTHLRYPSDAIQQKKEGTVLVSFIVNEKGKLENIHISAEAFPSLDQEALRLMKESPNWKPAIVKGKPVAQLVQMPIRFILALAMNK